MAHAIAGWTLALLAQTFGLLGLLFAGGMGASRLLAILDSSVYVALDEGAHYFGARGEKKGCEAQRGDGGDGTFHCLE